MKFNPTTDVYKIILKLPPRGDLCSMKSKVLFQLSVLENLTEPGKILSLSFWRDVQAVIEWRRVEAHRAAQIKGRTSVFENYRFRVAEVLRD